MPSARVLTITCLAAACSQPQAIALCRSTRSRRLCNVSVGSSNCNGKISVKLQLLLCTRHLCATVCHKQWSVMDNYAKRGVLYTQGTLLAHCCLCMLGKRSLSPLHLLHHICLPWHMHLEAGLLQSHAAGKAATPGFGSGESVACLGMRKMYIVYRSQPTQVH